MSTQKHDPKVEWGFYATTPRIVRTQYKNLSHTEKWLYVCLKDLCGDKGTCYRTLKALSQETDLSTGNLSTGIRHLHDAGLIHAEKKRRSINPTAKEVWHISIVDIWQSNVDYCSKFERSEENVQELNDNVQILNVPPAKRSENEQKRSNFDDRRKNIEEQQNEEESVGAIAQHALAPFYHGIPLTYGDALAYLAPHGGAPEGMDSVQVMVLAWKLWTEAHPTTHEEIADLRERTDDTLEEVKTASGKIKAIKAEGASNGQLKPSSESREAVAASSSTAVSSSPRSSGSTTQRAAVGRNHARAQPKPQLTLQGQQVREWYEAIRGNVRLTDKNTIAFSNLGDEPEMTYDNLKDVLEAWDNDKWAKEHNMVPSPQELDSGYLTFEKGLQIVKRNRKTQAKAAARDVPTEDDENDFGHSDFDRYVGNGPAERKAEYERALAKAAAGLLNFD